MEDEVYDMPKVLPVFSLLFVFVISFNKMLFFALSFIQTGRLHLPYTLSVNYFLIARRHPLFKASFFLLLFQGQNNLFHTIIFFLHHVKTKHYGMLG